MSWLNKIAEDHEVMAEAHKHAKELLGAKVVNSSFYGEGNATVGMAYLPIYDKDFMELLKIRADMAKKDLTEKDAQLIVNAVNYAKKEDKKD